MYKIEILKDIVNYKTNKFEKGWEWYTTVKDKARIETIRRVLMNQGLSVKVTQI